MARMTLERFQVLFYLAALAVGLGAAALPATVAAAERVLWPMLGLLLYATFTQVPLRRLPAAWRNLRFMSALLTANFVLVPVLVFLLTRPLADQPAVLLGLALVLLVPCTDWFLSFTHLGRGDTGQALAATPVLLLAQFLLLPFYLWLLGVEQVLGLTLGPLLQAFATFIVLPLLLAWLTQLLAARSGHGRRWVEALAWAPVPLLSLVLALVAATQLPAVRGQESELLGAAGVCIAYLLLVPWLGRWVAQRFGLPLPAARAVVFSVSTRNSFVMLPLALTLPAGLELAVAVIVLQSLIELLGMALYVRWIPQRLLPAAATTSGDCPGRTPFRS